MGLKFNKSRSILKKILKKIFLLQLRMLSPILVET